MVKKSNMEDNFYSYARKEIELDDELEQFIQHTCKNWKVFQELICNDVYYVDEASKGFQLQVRLMFEHCFKFRSKQALEHLGKRFGSVLGVQTRNIIWDKFIDVDNGS